MILAGDFTPRDHHPATDNPVCHCGEVITPGIESPIPDVCEDCFLHCCCWTCRDTRQDVAEDRAEQVSFDVAREAS